MRCGSPRTERTTKALTYTESGTLRFAEVARPESGTTSALVRVLATSICGTDLRTYRFGSKKITPPRIIGHEACGVIQELGLEIDGFQEGDRVVIAPAIGCGECPSCREGHTNMCDNLKTVGFEYDGTFAEYVGIPEQAFRMGNVIKLDSRIPSQSAALAEPIACCLNGQSFLNIRPGDSVVIFGAGFIGCIHAELASRSRASRIVIADISSERLDFAATMIRGVQTVNVAHEDIEAHVRELTDGRGADVIITANPDGTTHRAALGIAAKRARISLFGGVPTDDGCFLDSNTIHYRELSVYGSHATTPRLVRSVVDWISSGELDLTKYISGEYPLEAIMEAFESYRDPRVMKLVIRP